MPLGNSVDEAVHMKARVEKSVGTRSYKVSLSCRLGNRNRSLVNPRHYISVQGTTTRSSRVVRRSSNMKDFVTAN